MVRDVYLRLLFIPLLGFLIPFFSGSIVYARYSIAELIVAHLYFVFISFSIWQGCRWIHSRLRRLYSVKGSPYLKIISLCFIAGLYGASLAGLHFLVWMKFSREVFTGSVMVKFIALSTFAVIIFTLLYEVLYLSKERQLDVKKVDQLDKEKSLAELQALRNELDPHFIFNSLTSLSYLIRTDPDKAALFDNKLAQVFRYFLINKNHELISISKELEFIEDYFYLLQIRYEEKLQLQIINNHNGDGMIVPCSLQLLIENAIKHNAFSSEHPLIIKIELDEETICVSNNIQPKVTISHSTKIGLANLDQRYQLICHKKIIVEEKSSYFLVKLPVIKQNTLIAP